MDNLCCSNILLRLVISDVGKNNKNFLMSLAEFFAQVSCNTRAYKTNTNNDSCIETNDAILISDKKIYYRECETVKESTFCGALTAAIAVLYSEKDASDAIDAQDDIMEWFAGSFGGYDCEAIGAASIEEIRNEFCPKIILSTYLQLRTYIDPDNFIPQKTII